MWPKNLYRYVFFIIWRCSVFFGLSLTSVMMLNNTIWHEVYWNSCFKKFFTKYENQSQGLDQKHLPVGDFWSSQTKRFAKTENTLWKKKQLFLNKEIRNKLTINFQSKLSSTRSSRKNKNYDLSTNELLKVINPEQCDVAFVVNHGLCASENTFNQY